MTAFIKNMKNKFKAYWLGYLRDKKIIHRLIKFDLEVEELTFQIAGKSHLFKKNIFEVMGASKIIQGLPSTHACYIGFHYGLMRNNLKNKTTFKKAKDFCFELKGNISRYQLVSENKNGEITYVDKIYGDVFTELPTSMIQSHLIMSKFDPTQACYIGMVAGIMLEKAKKKDNNGDRKKNVEKLVQKKPKLRVIK